LANSPQARKRAKQSEKRRQHNASMRSMTRTYLKKVDAAIEAGDIEQATAAYTMVVSVLDRYANKGGVLHKNKAARHKNRLYKRIKALSA
jgi:small subunit ribosomal protein S20